MAHRPLKNSMRMREYALVTTPLAGMAEASGLGATPGRDEYDDIGAVDYGYLDLRGRSGIMPRSRWCSR